MAQLSRGHGIVRRFRNRLEVPRGVLSLSNETRRRDYPRLHWIVIAGRRYTGRCTLSARFNAIDGDEFTEGEVVVQNIHRLTINLGTRPAVNRSGHLHLAIFIDPGPTRDPVPRVNNFDVAIFLFDVNVRETLEYAYFILLEYRVLTEENMYPSILVGNKIDIRDNPRDDPEEEPVSFAEGEEMAETFGAISYHECSALRNIGVGPILDQVLQLALR